MRNNELLTDGLRRFGALVLADWRVRSRSAQFWGAVGLLAAATWWYLPPATAPYLTVAINSARGEYSSAWIGMVLALVSALLLSLVGFYLVRGTLTRDFETRVWQLLAITPLSRPAYLLAKWLSHLLVLVLLLVAGLVVGLAAQLVRAEDLHVNMLEMVKPVLVLALPALAVTATLAVWFDLLPWLRHTAGNVLYFFLWVTMITLPSIQAAGAGYGGSSGSPGWISDPLGILSFERALELAHVIEPGSRQMDLSIGASPLTGPLRRFAWPSWPVQAHDLLGAGFWMGLALVGLLLASPLLDWAAARARPAGPARAAGGRRLRWLDALLAPLQRTALGGLLAAELQMVLRARRGWWWLALLGVLSSQAALPTPAAVGLAALGGWVLLLDVMGHAALRERETNTAAFLLSTVGAGRRVQVARGLLLLSLTWAMTLPAALRLVVAEPVAALAVIVVGASLVGWGLALGSIAHTARPFELLVLVLAYGGFQGIAVLNPVTNPWLTIGLHSALLPLLLAIWWLVKRR